jgi:hypothetical protein
MHLQPLQPKEMTTFIILALLAGNIGQFLNTLDLKARYNSPLMSEKTQSLLDETFRFGVTPKSLDEGHENALHRKPPPFPKLP